MNVELEQGSPKWLEERKRHIGASDVAVILGISPWRTPYELYMDKITPMDYEKVPHTDKKFIFEKGHRLEAYARKLYETKCGFEIPPAVVKHADVPWCMVSLDGLNTNEKRLVEIKYMGRKNWRALKEKDEFPDYYYSQCQMQMFATGIQEMHLVAVTDEIAKYEKKKNPYFSGLAGTVVTFDKEYAKSMVSKCYDFWAGVLNREPPPLTDKDTVVVKDDDLIARLKHFRGLKQQIKALNEELKPLEEAIKASMTAPIMTHDEITVSYVPKKGSVDYSKIPHLEDVDLEPYRRKGTMVFRVSSK